MYMYVHNKNDWLAFVYAHHRWIRNKLILSKRSQYPEESLRNPVNIFFINIKLLGMSICLSACKSFCGKPYSLNYKIKISSSNSTETSAESFAGFFASLIANLNGYKDKNDDPTLDVPKK